MRCVSGAVRFTSPHHHPVPDPDDYRLALLFIGCCLLAPTLAMLALLPALLPLINSFPASPNELIPYVSGI